MAEPEMSASASKRRPNFAFGALAFLEAELAAGMFLSVYVHASISNMLRLYDSLTKEICDFAPSDGKTVRIYACGPTVYKDAHIGNLKTFTLTDLIRRYLEYRGYKVKVIMNITDVGHALRDEDTGEDKIEKSAKEEGKTPEEVARFYEARFMEDMKALNNVVSKYPRATDHIPEMIELVRALLDNGHAYLTEKGDVYYAVESFKDYGKLSGNTVEKLVAGARVEVAHDKRHPADFALWIHNPNHVMQWEAPWGKGYPGWHLECSAMARTYLGDAFDLHVGGEDLKFPHHECEIAQSEGAFGGVFCRRWLHAKHLFVEGRKMSKSLGNFFTLREILDKGYSPMAVRWLFLSAQYRQTLNFTFDGLDDAERHVKAFSELKERLSHALGHGNANTYLRTAQERFETAMDDDLNVSEALAVLHDFRKEMNRLLDEGRLNATSAKKAKKFLMKTLEGVFGIGLKTLKKKIPQDVEALVAQRDEARARKDWEESDRLREELRKLGWSVEDSSNGTQVKSI